MACQNLRGWRNRAVSTTFEGHLYKYIYIYTDIEGVERNSGFHPTNWISPFSLPGENVSSSNDASRSKSPTKKSLGQRYCHVYREGELEELPPGELFLMGKHPPSFFPTKNGPEEVCENRGPGTPPCFFFFFFELKQWWEDFWHFFVIFPMVLKTPWLYVTSFQPPKNGGRWRSSFLRGRKTPAKTSEAK